MPKFGTASKLRLASCDIRLQGILKEAIRYVDFTVVWGHRGEEDQDMAFELGASHLKWPESKHNKLPSLAVDVAPYPKLFSETDRVAEAAEFSFLAGILVGIAHTQGVTLVWGGDWNGNLDTTDQTLQDWGHLEIRENT